MQAGAGTLLQTVAALKEGNLHGQPQQEIEAGELKHAPKIFKEDCKIDWEQPLERVYNLVRGLSPYPAAFTALQGKTLKIYKAVPEASAHAHAPGSVHSDGKTYLKFAAPGGYLNVLELQLEGKKKMGVEEFLRGFRFS